MTDQIKHGFIAKRLIRTVSTVEKISLNDFIAVYGSEQMKETILIKEIKLEFKSLDNFYTAVQNRRKRLDTFDTRKVKKGLSKGFQKVLDKVN